MMNCKMTRSLAFGLLTVFLAITALHATETENLGIRVLPAPGKVVVDGEIGDWDLSAGVFTCSDVEHQRATMAIWFHAMYDSRNLYLLARWNDETPLNNPGQTMADYGFAGDCLQFRIITHPEDANERTSHWTCWRGRDGDDIMGVEYGKQFNQGNLKNAKTKGAQQAFLINAPSTGSTSATDERLRARTCDSVVPLAQGRSGSAESGRSFRHDDRAELHVGPKRPRYPERHLQTRGLARSRVCVHGKPVLGLRHAGRQRPRRSVTRAIGRRARVSGETPKGPTGRGLDRTHQVQVSQRLQGHLVHHAGRRLCFAQHQRQRRTARTPTLDQRLFHEGQA